MKPSLVQQLTLYRYRYAIGYALFALFLIGILFVDITNVPYGVSDSEMTSSVASNSLNPLAATARDVINLPYHLLQKLSIGLFGLSPLTVRLPSLILAFITAILLALTLHQWFKRNTALVALLITTTSVPFMTMARSGTAGILYMLLLVLILLSAVRLTSRGNKTFFWKIAVTAAGILLIYMPLGLYAIAALLLAGLFHPHVRYQIKRTKWWQLIVLGVISAILLAPLAIAGATDPNTLETLLGVNGLDDKLTASGIGSSLVFIAQSLFMFHKPQIGEILTPFLNLPFMLLIAFGLVQTIIHRHAARSYLLLVWLLVSVPLLIVNPSQYALLFVPSVILMAIGFDALMREWYKLFPRNPYARLSALLPLSLIVIGLIAIAGSRYFYGYYYTDTTKTNHPELTAIRSVLAPQTETELVVPSRHIGFYDILRSKYPNLTVVADRSTGKPVRERVVLGDIGPLSGQTPKRIITSYLADDAVLLRVYGNR